MKISNFSISRRITTAMIVLLVVLIGIIAFSRLKVDLYPDVTFPGAAIVTSYSGVGPEEIENLITKPVESSVSTVTGVKSVSSTSDTGQSTIVVEFEWGTDMDFAVLDLRQQIDLISGFLPDEAEDTLIFKFDPAMFPILSYGITGEQNLADLKTEVEDNIVPRLERLPGVAQVNLDGGLTREILVSLEGDKLYNYGIDFSTVNGILAQENVNVSAGEIQRGDRNLLIRTMGKFNSIDDIRNINIPAGNGNTVKLSDLGSIQDTYAERSTISRVNGNSSIGLSIQKQTDANTVQAANAVKAEIEKIQNEYDDLNIITAMDQSDFIEKAIESVQRNAVIGGLLAVLILFIFLRNIRSTIVIGTAIPVSIIATFVLMFFADLNINIISLGGLALGVGMLVDNAIVVLENIYRYRSMGVGKIEAAKEGSSEVGMAITASTLTTIVVFLPVFFVEGIAARLFKELALTVSFSLFASLAVALTLIPMLASTFLKVSQKDLDRESKQGFVTRNYKRMLAFSLNHRWIIVLILVVLLAGSIALVPGIGTEFLPESDQGMFTISYDLPASTILAESDNVAQYTEDVLASIPEVKTVFSSVGSADMMGTSTSSDSGNITVLMKDLDERDRSTDQIMEEVRQRLSLPDVNFQVSTQTGFGGGGGGGKPINIKLKGNDFAVLEEYTTLAREEMENIEGLRDISDSFDEGRPELRIQLNRSLMSQFGLNARQIANTVRTAVSGSVATRYEVAGDEYDIRVQLRESDLSSVSQLSNLNINAPGGIQVPLKRFANLEVETGPNQILRIDQERYAEINSDLYNIDLGTAVERIQNRLNENIELPEGYEFSYEGQFQDLQSSFQSLAFAFLLAVVLVYMVMASQFESLIHPLIIMFTVPLAIIGVILGIYITGSTLSVASLIGLITLAGIVVNNAIVMVDYINHLRREKQEKNKAILEAAAVRLRPIMMTALTTILGLIPLSLGRGDGGELAQPIAVVVISGLTFATFLTLFIIPIFYSLLTSFREIVLAKIKGVDRSELEEKI
ncbi:MULTISPECIES: efflux RND transporter permease subunit [Halanaerobium]|jgi:HAE1 family hydrophobic/amphiphilic exporter-1|uniref:HAE1 family hydrophobic/amphiphilic exporter-1 n=1 Tax=Halanaerobium saccharolyticum TaxID=43595 RepID=A0A4V6PVL9_9FIRM|nr:MULTISPECIES: efflux RND transporter permease subunit [Halanaerobium]PUU95245.1 MAG: hydrophobic/amphiphilic exporter-1 (mainly G- bacteria), HAE1 family [Halanaerobium sp.]TDP90438.1 HAE1 family hydrophobic/amphiphilic exporter-1 [Halanaerobium saccharolyticum]